MNTKEFESVKPFLDKDIIEIMEEKIADTDGILYPRNYFIYASALVSTNIQLIRILKEAFSRGFIVQK